MKKSKPSEGAELVLAYLEDAQRVRAALAIVDGRGRAVPAGFGSVQEDKVVLSPQGVLTLDKGAAVSLVFQLDGLRFKAATKLIEAKPGSATFELPSSLALAERRKKPRARLNAREGATVIALTGLFDGIGLNGSIENISESGLCMRVDRAMDVKTQRKMHMGANLLQVGQPFMLIKLTKLPKCPTIELSGTVAYVDAGQGMLVGVTFESGKESLLSPVRSLVASRTTAIPTSVPPKARRQPEAPRNPEEGSPAPRVSTPSRKEPEPAPTGEPEPRVEPSPTPAPPPAAPVEPAGAAEPIQEVEGTPLDERSQALLRMKKRTRGILLAMADGPDRDALMDFLIEEGYGRVMFTETLTDLLQQVERPGINLIFVDGGVAEVQGLALASLLRRALEDQMPPVILAETSVDTELVLGAHETGVAQILVKPYDLDPDFRRMIEEHLGIA